MEIETNGTRPTLLQQHVDTYPGTDQFHSDLYVHHSVCYRVGAMYVLPCQLNQDAS